jgi:hypothetical protein
VVTRTRLNVTLYVHCLSLYCVVPALKATDPVWRLGHDMADMQTLVTASIITFSIYNRDSRVTLLTRLRAVRSGMAARSPAKA